MTHTLTVYIADDCWSCEETQRILADVTPNFPELQLRCVNTQKEPMPEEVFAVPTYLLDGKVISLGNPTRKFLRQRLTALFAVRPSKSQKVF
ncbi:MAG: hypothetical protein DHS20C20_07800 [Ardenticatenaceae bacterium]|nr:MAG: hypothetical protein DHS20C20_07800 [Ardenticatenaceae bacterium]